MAVTWVGRLVVGWMQVSRLVILLVLIGPGWQVVGWVCLESSEFAWCVSRQQRSPFFVLVMKMQAVNLLIEVLLVFVGRELSFTLWVLHSSRLQLRNEGRFLGRTHLARPASHAIICNLDLLRGARARLNSHDAYAGASVRFGNQQNVLPEKVQRTNGRLKI